MILLGTAVVLYLLGASKQMDDLELADEIAFAQGGYIPLHLKALFILGWPLHEIYNLATNAIGSKDDTYE